MTHLQSILLFKDSSRQQKEGDAPFFGQIAVFVVSSAAPVAFFDEVAGIDLTEAFSAL